MALQKTDNVCAIVIRAVARNHVAWKCAVHVRLDRYLLRLGEELPVIIRRQIREEPLDANQRYCMNGRWLRC